MLTAAFKWLLIAVCVVAVLAVGAGQLGLLQGTPPADLGVRDGRLKPPSVTPNSVSSQADLHPDNPQHKAAMIDPLVWRGSDDPRQAMPTLARLVRAMPGASVVTQRDDYLYVRFTTPVMHFVDDAEFWLDAKAKVIHVRSASRIGRKDFDANRRRIEHLRSQLASASAA